MTGNLKAAELKREKLTKSQWEKFKMNEVQLRAHLAGLACVFSDVFIISTDYRFCVYAITDDMSPVISFFKKFRVAKHVTLYNSTQQTLHQLLASVMLITPADVVKLSGKSIESSYRMAKEAESISPSLEHLLNKLIKKQNKENGYEKFLSVVPNQKIGNGYFNRQS